MFNKILHSSWKIVSAKIEVMPCICYFVTCVAFVKAGLEVGPVRPTLLGCLVCVICNFKSFPFFLLKLGIMIVHILKTCTSYFVHISRLFFHF